MDHKFVLELLPGYLDQELGLSEALEFERHLDGCEQCRQAYAQHREVSAQLRQAALRVDAPQALAQRIEAALPSPRVSREKLGERFRRWLGSRSLSWAPVGATLASVVALSVSMSLYLAVPSPDQRLTQQLVDDHIRSLQSDHLFDVVSTDKHTVKPWFNGKLDFAPPVVDLAQQGYPLVGGRLDFVNQRPVAVMVYRYKLHPINLYVWPGNEAGAKPQVLEQRGYHLAHWNAAGMNYWAITDAGAGELDAFIRDLLAQLAA